MRTFELLFIAFDGALLIALSSAGLSPTLLKSIWIGSLFCLAVHLLWERPRWQMIWAYAVSLGLGIVWVVSLQTKNNLGLLASLLGVSLLGAAILSGTVLPIFSLPKPDGKYPLGTFTRRWVYNNPKQGAVSRAVKVQFWYPAQTNVGRRAAYRNAETWTMKSAHLELVKTHAIVNAPIAASQKSIPVILFSPAWNGKGNQNTIQCEMLASHGFAVVAVDHPVSPDIPADFDMASEQKLPRYSIEAKRRAEDISFAIDQFTWSGQHDPHKLLISHFDLSRIGVFGHSFGGAVAAEACCMDSRVRAGINMDGLLFGDAAQTGIAQPFFFMSDDTPQPTTEELQNPDEPRRMRAQAIDKDMKRVQRSLTQYGGYYLSADGIAHNNYSDRILYSPLRRLTGAGSIGSKRSIEIVNRYTLAFFKESLKEEPQALLRQVPSEYPEVHFERYKRSVSHEQHAKNAAVLHSA
jgi:dienelactone hydrolase